MPFPITQVRADFPILQQKVYNTPLVYFDNAASTQKPRQVIQAIVDYYEKDNCNIHRGVHYLSQKATEAYENTRKSVQKFIHARCAHEIIFTRGTTESINLVASSLGKTILGKDDEILISAMEHHSNFVPWQMLCKEKEAKLKFIPLHEDGTLNMIKFMAMVTKKTKLIAISHVSNVLGTINPIKEIIQFAHQQGIPVLVDGAQAISHTLVDVQSLDCDFYCFSGHKMYAPMGIGVLYGKEKYLEMMPPYQTGGEMIKEVFFDHSTFNDLPFKFEAGTPNVEGVYGLNAAIKYLNELGMAQIAAYEAGILKYATERISSVGDIRIIGTSAEKTSLISFLIGKIHPSDAGIIIDKLGIAVRTGHHCAMPLMDFYKIAGTIRASFAFYNTEDEVDRLVAAIITVKQMFS